MILRASIILIFVVSICGQVTAQKQQVVDYFHDENGNTYHQIYLDEKATELLDIKYHNDDQDIEIDGNLSSDGYSLIIKNYQLNKAVSVKVLLENGEVKEILRSKCHIDPLVLVL